MSASAFFFSLSLGVSVLSVLFPMYEKHSVSSSKAVAVTPRVQLRGSCAFGRRFILSLDANNEILFKTNEIEL